MVTKDISPKELKKGEIKKNYVLPNFLSIALSKVPVRTQFESSIISMLLMMIGLVLTNIYIWLYLNMDMIFKVLTSMNSFFGVIFFWSALVTNWQAYQSHLDILQYQLDQAKLQDKKEVGDAKENS